MDSYSVAETVAQEHLRELLDHLSEAHKREVDQLREAMRQLADASQKVDAARQPTCAANEFGSGLEAARPVDFEQGACSEPSSPDASVAGAEGKAGQRSISKNSSDAGHLDDHPEALSGLDHSRPSSSNSASRATRRFTTAIAGKISEIMKEGDLNKERSKYLPVAKKRFEQMMRGKQRHASLGTAVSLRSMVEHTAFDSLCAIVIILNSFIIGWDVEWRTTHDGPDVWTEAVSYVCNLFFLVELLLRLCVHRLHFFFDPDNYLWNWFDTLLVIFSLFELFTSAVGWSDDSSGSTGFSIKAVKMLRIARVFRVFRFFTELTLLAMMVIDSLKSLAWALILLFIIIFVFAVLFTQFATTFIKENGHLQPSSVDVFEVQRQFGNLRATVYTLVQSMLGGVSWGVASDALFSINWLAAPLFFFYIFFTMLAFLNITTGVFVDNAVEAGRIQRDYLVQKEMQLKDRYAAEIRELFVAMDNDGSGTLTLEEVKAYFDNPQLQSYFAALGIDFSDTERLFTLLDNDSDGHLTIDEFLDGCSRLKGQASSIDVQHLLTEFKKLNRRFDLMSRECRMTMTLVTSRQSVAAPRQSYAWAGEEGCRREREDLVARLRGGGGTRRAPEGAGGSDGEGDGEEEEGQEEEEEALDKVVTFYDV
mmetsp:Transcript_77830/g.241169  ORF Transcript_77830/g.241169 Transcript_77830/m.241169 type:complete len:650 (-) Transcript_77830:14-1963(-)